LNEGIRHAQVKLITETGEQILMSKSEALARAKDFGLDLFLVSPTAEPPIAKILDYGHYRYDKEKKQKEARKKNNQKAVNIVKELKLTPRIGAHDFNVRVKHGREFLEKGYKVKITVFFKGREDTHPELGQELIFRFLEQVGDLGWTETATVYPRLLGKTMSVLVVSGRKKPEATMSVQEEKKEIIQNA
jgi:translation initiation factor IF-3